LLRFYLLMPTKKVNAGICWMYAILVRAGVLENAQTASELAVTGTISFVLTVLNIACIWVAGMLMFAIKVSQFLLFFCWCAPS
jgi:hypothetical protein